MAAPAVRDINNIIKELNPSVAAQKKLIDADIAMNATAGAAQEAGLAAQAQQAYGQIEQRAQDKNMLFSGFSPSEQANYNATSYLPALAQLQATIAGTRSQLLGKKADIDTNIFNKAFDTRENDIAVANDWKKMDYQQQWQAKQSQLDRDFQASQNALDRAEQQKDRAAAAAQVAAGNARSAQEALDGDRKAISTELFQVTGDDGYVSPGSYAKAKNAWVGSGYSANSFDSYFSSYRNPKNTAYKLGG